jgi:hypothetical protein
MPVVQAQLDAPLVSELRQAVAGLQMAYAESFGGPEAGEPAAGQPAAAQQPPEPPPRPRPRIWTPHGDV